MFADASMLLIPSSRTPNDTAFVPLIVNLASVEPVIRPSVPAVAPAKVNLAFALIVISLAPATFKVVNEESASVVFTTTVSNGVVVAAALAKITLPVILFNPSSKVFASLPRVTVVAATDLSSKFTVLTFAPTVKLALPLTKVTVSTLSHVDADVSTVAVVLS